MFLAAGTRTRAARPRHQHPRQGQRSPAGRCPQPPGRSMPGIASAIRTMGSPMMT